jgi:hypothetical protein
MKAKNLFLLAAVFLLTSAARERTYMGQKVVDLSVPIVGGETLSLPVTAAGPIPAENRAFKVEVAGFNVHPSLVGPREATLSWGFVFTSKASKELARVLVEEVYPGEVAKVVVDDRSPALKDKMWSGRSAAVLPSPDTTAWLYIEEPSLFVFRFTITPLGKSPVVLYQPAWFSPPVKGQFRQVIMNINAG